MCPCRALGLARVAGSPTRPRLACAAASVGALSCPISDNQQSNRAGNRGTARKQVWRQRGESARTKKCKILVLLVSLRSSSRAAVGDDYARSTRRPRRRWRVDGAVTADGRVENFPLSTVTDIRYPACGPRPPATGFVTAQARLFRDSHSTYAHGHAHNITQHNISHFTYLPPP